ncbi:uncharacterized protein MELLADRAFT_95690 [Melampsora larici-populina 98AG31]|uniref:Uncharacterized protein n=1 Tax=Melampsora larici-populina (strain 98AG31 / pathotype 3-4-7) TaxID=747676 RepID=F4SA94_MELLP|nr:uncharacterized protein MELLADRAFT_95690 [Melampsora larici-populina 98AG31]EGF98443.1 hypothetical protein MELLADRAFT_95690 [Melampsora larici-populina 98AG31]
MEQNSSDLDACDGEDLEPLRRIWPEGSAHLEYTPKVVSKSEEDDEKVVKEQKPIKNLKARSTPGPRRSSRQQTALEIKESETLEKEAETLRHQHFEDSIDLDSLSVDEDGVPRSYYEELEAIDDTRALMNFLESDIADSSDLDACDEEEILKCIWPRGSAHFEYIPKVVSQRKDDIDDEKHINNCEPINNSKNPTDQSLLKPIPEALKDDDKRKVSLEKRIQYSNPTIKGPSQNLPASIPESPKEVKKLQETEEKPIKYLKPIRNPLNPNGRLLPAPIPKQTRHYRKKEALKEMGSEASLNMVANWCKATKPKPTPIEPVNHIDPVLIQLSKGYGSQIPSKRKRDEDINLCGWDFLDIIIPKQFFVWSLIFITLFFSIEIILVNNLMIGIDVISICNSNHQQLVVCYNTFSN